MVDKKVKDTKKRYWTFLLYPDSAPVDWYDRLEQSGLRGEISPLHDRDVNLEIDPKTGKAELKKSHYHIVLCYDGPTTYNAVLTFIKQFGACIAKPVGSVRGIDRYLTHMDNPEKAQYDRADIRTFGGFDIRDFVELSASEKQRLRVKVMGIIRDYEIVEYSDLLDLLLDSDMPDELETAMSNTLLFRGYIDSRRCGVAKHKMQEQARELGKAMRAAIADKPSGKGGKVISLAERREEQ